MINFRDAAASFQHDEMNLRKALTILVLILLPCSFLLAQNPFIRHFTTTDGLPSNAISTICQDHEKFLWFATEGGLVRYDGSSFTDYNTSDGLYRNFVILVKEDSHGRVWFFCIGAQPNYLYQDKIYNTFNAPFLDTLRGNWTFVEDRQGNLYFYNYHSRRITVLDSNNHVQHYMIQFDPPENKTFGEQDLNIHHMVRIPSGEYMIWTFEGIYKTGALFEKPVKIRSFDRYQNIYLVNDTIIYDVADYPDSHSSVMVRYLNGVPEDTIELKEVALDLNSWLLEDREGNVWVSSPDKGIYCLKNKNVIYHLDLKGSSWICKDHEGNIWATSKNGAYRISPNVLLFKHFDNSNFEGGGIDALSADPSGRVWGINGTTAFLYQDDRIYNMDISYRNALFYDFLALSNNSLLFWDDQDNNIALTGITVNQENKKLTFEKLIPLNLVKYTGIPSANKNHDILCFWGRNDLATCSVKDNFEEIDRIPIGRAMKVFYDARDNLVVLESGKHYIIEDHNKIPYDEFAAMKKITSLMHKTLGSAADVFLTFDDSLILVKNKKAFNLTASFDYSFNTPVKKIAYQSPVLYLSTFRNIYACDNPLEIEENKPISLRLIDINFSDIRDIEAVHDSLFIASSDGMTIIPISLINQIQSKAPLPYFHSVKINDQETDLYLKESSVKGKNKISFEFGSINYSDNPALYSYKLEGFDQEWNIGPVNKVTYGNLPKGHYTFILKAGKSNSPWSEPITYAIKVRATIWQHPLFIATLAILCAGLIFLYILYRKNLQMKKTEIEHQLVTLEQKALQSMMNPHFLFNALGSIQNYLLQNKAGEAGLYLSQFARLIRQNISSIHSAMISLEAEVDRLKNYLDLEKLRMANRFDYKIEIDKDIEEDDVLIPSMITQPFVENCILHGISPLEKDGLIRISFAMISEKIIRIIIEDNGVGIKQSKAFKTNDRGHLHMSMEMTQKRIEILGKKYKVKTSVEVTDAFPGSPNPGTRVTVVLPVSYDSSPP
jgi:streptogramin lyase